MSSSTAPPAPFPRTSAASKRRRPAPLALSDDDDESLLLPAQENSASSAALLQPQPSALSLKPSKADRFPSSALPPKWSASTASPSAAQSPVHEKERTRYADHPSSERATALRPPTSSSPSSSSPASLSAMDRCHSSPASLLIAARGRAYRSRQYAEMRDGGVDSDDDASTSPSTLTSLKRQRTSPSPFSPLHTLTPPCSPAVVGGSAHCHRVAFPVQPSPSPLLRQLSLDSDSAAQPSSPQSPSSETVTTLTSTSTTLTFTRQLSLIIEEAEDIIVPMPYTPTPHPSPASPVASSASLREGRIFSRAYMAVSTRRGVRKSQQDAWAWANAAGDDGQLPTLFAVMDGHGAEGAEVSTEAAELLPHLFFTTLLSSARAAPSSPSSSSEPSGEESVVSAAFHTAFVMADHHVCEEKGYRGGSTACCAYIAPTEASSSASTSSSYTLHVASVGDSRALLFSALRPPVLLTTDHSTSSQSEQERISAAGGHLLFTHSSLRVNGVLNVTRSIGDLTLKQFVIAQPEQQQRDVQADDDFLLLITDGITNVLTLDDLQALLTDARGEAPGQVADRIVDSALKRGSKDNVTAVVIHLPTYGDHLRAQQSRNAAAPVLECGRAEVRTPSPSRERLHALLPPVPPFTSGSTPSTPTEDGDSEAGDVSSGVVCGFLPPPLTTRSSLSASFFAMVPAREEEGLVDVQ